MRIDFISTMEWIGTIAFAVSGALVGIRKGLDYYGVCVLAIITAIGGGIIRDVLINRDLPASLENPEFIVISIATAIVVILFHEKTERLMRFVNLADAVGLAAFVAVGSQVAATHNRCSTFVIITLAVLTGTGGGVLRDIFVQEIPVSFRKEIYASAAIVGALAFAGTYNQIGVVESMYLAFGVTLGIRLLAIHKGWQLGKVTVNYRNKL